MNESKPLTQMLSRALNQPRARYDAGTGRIIFPEQDPVKSQNHRHGYAITFTPTAEYTGACTYRQVEKEFNNLEQALIWFHNKLSARRVRNRYVCPWFSAHVYKIHATRKSVSETTTLIIINFNQ